MTYDVDFQKNADVWGEVWKFGQMRTREMGKKWAKICGRPLWMAPKDDKIR